MLMCSHKATFRPLLLLVALALAAAACGGETGNGDADAPEGTDSAEDASDSAEDPEGTDSTEAAPDDTEEPAPSGGTDGADSPSFPVSEDLELLLQDMGSWAVFAGESNAGSQAMEGLGGGAMVKMEAMEALRGGTDPDVGSLLYLGVYPAGADQAMFNDEVVADLPDDQPVIVFRVWTGE